MPIISIQSAPIAGGAAISTVKKSKKVNNMAAVPGFASPGKNSKQAFNSGTGMNTKRGKYTKPSSTQDNITRGKKKANKKQKPLTGGGLFSAGGA